MESKFSAKVKDVISESRLSAIKCKNDFIGIEHFILGIIETTECSAYRALTYLKVDLIALKESLIANVQGNNENVLGSIPLTVKAEKVLKNTFLEAKVLNSKLITSYHLLMAILKDENDFSSKLLIDKYNIDRGKLVDLSTNSIYEYINSVEIEIVELKKKSTLKKKKPIKKLSGESSLVLPLSLIFDTSEYSDGEISKIILLLSELYSDIGGDYLKVTGSSKFERIIELA
jgi:ATP-dependent Clp protease ATP-binding subunit ClpA